MANFVARQIFWKLQISLEILMKWCKIEYMNKVILCGGSCYLASIEWKKENWHDSITWLGKSWIFLYETTLPLHRLLP